MATTTKSKPAAATATAGWTARTLLDGLAAHGVRPAVLEVRSTGPAVRSYSEIAGTAGRLAAGLRAKGIGPGGRVGLCAPNSAEWIIAWLGIAAAGAVAVPVDDQAGEAEIAATLKEDRCRLALVSPAHAKALRRDGADMETHVLGGRGGGKGTASWRGLLGPAGPLPPVEPDAPATLMQSSGTTGAPKRFILSHANIGANVAGIAAEGLVAPGDGVLLPLPLHHAYPLVVGVLVSLQAGATVVLPEAVTGPALSAALRRPEVTAVVGVPRLYNAMLAALESRGFVLRAALGAAAGIRRRFGPRPGRVLARPLRARISPNLRLMVSGGAYLDPDAIWKLEGLGWQVLCGYGLAETSSLLTGNLPDARRVGSEGRALVGAEVKILRPDARGEGEILLRGPNVFAGYLDNPEANRASFTGDGWFRTGDLGRLDADGFLYVTGRVKEIIVLGGGKKVSPEHLEEIYGRSPCVQEIAVLERAGKLVALVRPDAEAIRAMGGASATDAVRVALTSIGQELPPHQRLAGLVLVTRDLPRTRLGKYRRFLLPEIYEAGGRGGAAAAAAPLTDQDRALLRQRPARDVWRHLRARFGAKAVTLDASPELDLGLDSIERLNLTLELREKFGLALDETAVAGAATIRELLAGVQAAGAAAPAPVSVPVAPPRPRGPLLMALATLAYGLNWVTMRFLFRLRVAGTEHLPARGPFVLIANHASDLDPLALAAALPLRVARRVQWSGDAARLFSTRLTRFLCRVARIMPVDERAPEAALVMAGKVLAQGDGLIWFPEAWRSPDGELQRFQPGIGRIVAESRAPVVPALVTGTFEALPRGRLLPRLARLGVTVGAALDRRGLKAAGADGSAPVADSLHRKFAAFAKSAGRSGGSRKRHA